MYVPGRVGVADPEPDLLPPCGELLPPLPPPDPDPPETLTGPGQTITETINITQWVQQSIYDWGPACQWYACRGEYAATGNSYCPVGPVNLNEYPI